mgnify:CR=1 FL=1
MVKRSFDNFDEFANEYRSIHTENIRVSGADSFYFAMHKVQLVSRYEANAQSSRLLDIGCGDGVAEMFMAKLLPGCRVDGIDISAKSIAAASEKNISGASFTVYDGKQIPFPDNSFDILFMAAVLHHVDFTYHAVLMKEMHRVLKPGGRVYLFEHNPLNPVTRYLVNTCVFDKDARLLGYRYCGRLLKQAAFRDIRKKFILFFPRKGFLSRLIKLEEKMGWLPLGGQYMYRARK